MSGGQGDSRTAGPAPPPSPPAARPHTRASRNPALAASPGPPCPRGQLLVPRARAAAFAGTHLPGPREFHVAGAGGSTAASPRRPGACKSPTSVRLGTGRVGPSACPAAGPGRPVGSAPRTGTSEAARRAHAGPRVHQRPPGPLLRSSRLLRAAGGEDTGAAGDQDGAQVRGVEGLQCDHACERAGQWRRARMTGCLTKRTLQPKV